MYWANFTLPLRRPQKGCFSAISCPRTAGWSQVPRLLKIGFFFFANMHLNCSPTTGSGVVWAELPVERSIRGVCAACPSTLYQTGAPAHPFLLQGTWADFLCKRSWVWTPVCAMLLLCSSLYPWEANYDMWTHCAKVRQRDTNCFLITECLFSLLGKLEVVSAFMGSCCHTGGCTKDVRALCLFLSSPHTSARSRLCGLILSSGVWCWVLEAQPVFEEVQCAEKVHVLFLESPWGLWDGCTPVY